MRAGERWSLRQRIECARAGRGPRRKERTVYLLNNDDSCMLPSEMLAGMECSDEMSTLVFKSGSAWRMSSVNTSSQPQEHLQKAELF